MTVNNTEYFYKIVFNPFKMVKEKDKILRKVRSMINEMNLIYYYNLENGGYEIHFQGSEPIKQEALMDIGSGKEIGRVEEISKEHYWDCRTQMKKHMEIQFIPEDEYQKMSEIEKYNHFKKMIESFVLKNDE